MLLKHQRFSALFVIILCSFLCMADCTSVFAAENGKAEDILAEINSVKITRADYDNEINAFKEVANPQAAAQIATPEGQKDFLRQLVEVRMFEEKALQDKLDKSPEFERDFREQMKAVLAIDHVKKLLNSVTVDDASVKEAYNSRIKEFTELDQYHLFQISTDSNEKAEAIVKDLNAGKTFSEVAKASSLDDAKDNGGDKGFKDANELAPEIMAALVSLKQDEVSKPVKIDSDLYIIVKYTEKKAGEVKAFEVVSAQLRRELLGVKQQEVYKNEIDNLKKELNFKLDDKALETLRKENLTDAEKSVALATFADQKVTVGEVFAEFEQIPPFIRPQILKGDGLKDFVDQRFGRDLSIAAVGRNYDKLVAENAKLVTDTRRRSLVKYLFDKILEPVKVDEKEAKEYYDKNLAEFAVPAQTKAHHILVDDEATAKKLLEDIEKGTSKFEDVAKASSKCPSGQQGGDLGAFGEGQMVPEFDKACKEATVGKAFGPVKTQFGYHLIRVDERIPSGTLKFEDVKNDIMERRLLPEKQKNTFETYRDNLRKEFNVKEYQENL